jgi:hypothetical protein
MHIPLPWTQNVFWTNGDIPDRHALPLPDCAGGPRCRKCEFHGLVSDGTTVFWSNAGAGALPNSSGSIVKCSDLDAGCGSNPTVLVSTPTLNPRQITVDASHVYWTEYDASFAHNGQVLKCGRSGCGGVPDRCGSNRSYDLAPDEASTSRTTAELPSGSSFRRRGGQVFRQRLWQHADVIASQASPRGIGHRRRRLLELLRGYHQVTGDARTQSLRTRARCDLHC